MRRTLLEVAVWLLAVLVVALLVYAASPWLLEPEREPVAWPDAGGAD